MNDDQFEQLVAHASTLTTQSQADVRGWAKVLLGPDPVGDAQAICSVYEGLGTPMQVSAFDEIVNALSTAGQILGVVMPVLGAAQQIKGILFP